MSKPVSRYTSPPSLADSLSPYQWRAVPLVVWLLLQCSAWSLGHTSAVGRTLGLYCVYEDRAYEEHEQVASAAQVASGGELSARGGSE